jgi:hypothetical protein
LKTPHTSHALEDPVPCYGCPKAERCAQGLACAALSLFVNTGSGVAESGEDFGAAAKRCFQVA